MRIRAVVVLFIVMLGFVGCSKEGASSSSASNKKKRLVPVTVPQLESSSDFKLDYTTKGGIKIYVRNITSEAADSINPRSRDYKFLGGGTSGQYLLAIAYNGKIESQDSLAEIMERKDSGFPKDEYVELFKYFFKRMATESAADWEKLQREAAQ